MTRPLLALLTLLILAPTAQAAPRPKQAWHTDLDAAFAEAQRTDRLVLAVYVSGDFADPVKLCASGKLLRGALRAPRLEPLLASFVPVHRTAGTVTLWQRGARLAHAAGGDVAVFVCRPDRRVVHAIAGAVPTPRLERELRWAQAHADRPDLAALHRRAARRLTRVRVLEPAAPQPLGRKLIDLRAQPARPVRGALRRAVIHGYLARPSATLAQVGDRVWTALLRQERSDVPARIVRVRLRCRLPLKRRWRCNGR